MIDAGHMHTMRADEEEPYRARGEAIACYSDMLAAAPKADATQPYRSDDNENLKWEPSNTSAATQGKGEEQETALDPRAAHAECSAEGYLWAYEDFCAGFTMACLKMCEPEGHPDSAQARDAALEAQEMDSARLRGEVYLAFGRKTVVLPVTGIKGGPETVGSGRFPSKKLCVRS